MKVMVKREFRDRKCGLVLRRIGEKFGATKERAEELEKLGFVSRIMDPDDKEVIKEQEGGDPDISH